MSCTLVEQIGDAGGAEGVAAGEGSRSLLGGEDGETDSALCRVVLVKRRKGNEGEDECVEEGGEGVEECVWRKGSEGEEGK